MRANLPPEISANLLSPSRSTLAITSLPFASFRKPVSAPSGPRGIAAPDCVPTDITDTGKENRCALAILLALAISRISSVMIRILPELTSASLNKAIARSRPLDTWLP